MHAFCLALEHLYPLVKEALDILVGALLSGHQALPSSLIGLEHLHALRKEAFSQFPVALLSAYEVLRNSLVGLLKRGEQRPGSVSDLIVGHDRTPHSFVTNSERASAIRAGLDSPSISMVLRILSKIRPLPCGSTASNTTRSLTRDPDFTGARNRTLSRP